MTEPPKKLTRSDIKRQQIVEAAVAEFMEKGYEAASMDRISARAEVSKRTVYNHFASKELLFEAIIERVYSPDEDFAAITFDPERDLRDQLQEIAHIYINFATTPNYINLNRVVVSEFVRDHVTSSKAREQFVPDDPPMDAFITAAIVAGKLRPVEPGYAATQFFSLIKAFTYWPLLMGNPLASKEDLDAIIEDNVNMFLTYYAVEK